ncbi:uncharacterized protein LOC108733383 isoform X2 [Agrilus planipennis]|uniref:Uncharacterized protein LOC108733383 isoform X2 n=1 Tax=Agrilus planipennis TaxID=224129 RepID=A0A1W4WHT9_AGRPL|nr:uncharacterized protein LOC108733383 isoform X2 [Agrilus planipennis]
MDSRRDFSVLGKEDIKQQLDGTYRDNIRRHNENVDKNRHILNQIINCITFCGAFELALRGYDETENSDNPDVFLGVVDFISELDLVMKEHLLKATAFQGTSKTIQNELLDAMLDVCRSDIKHQIRSSTFLAIQADETTDVDNKKQIAIIFRYVHNGIITERFWGFVRPEGHTDEHIANALLNELETIGVEPEKLIAQCFDGVTVTNGQFGGIQAKIKERFPHAHFIHSYAHPLNNVIIKAASINKNVKIFFANIHDFLSFFSSSTKRRQLLDEIVKTQIPWATPIRWNFAGRTVSTVFENKDLLIKCLEVITDSANDTKTINESTRLLNYLHNEDFLFWLSLFYRVMPHINALCCQLQEPTATGPYIKTCLSTFELELTKIKSEPDYIIIKEENDCKRLRFSDNFNDNSTAAAQEVCDVILTQLKSIFAFTDHLSLSNLLAKDNFNSYKVDFPESDFQTTVQCYNFFDTGKLRSELNILYKREDMGSMEGVSALLNFLKENELNDAFSEVYKLCNIIATIPMATVENDRCFSTLKRVKTFLRNTVIQDRLTALTMLSVEKKMVKQIRDFNNKVFNIFVNANGRQADFHYK